MVSCVEPISTAIFTSGLLRSAQVCGLAKPFLVMTVKECTRIGVEKSMTSARSGVGFTAKARSILSAWRSRIWLPPGRFQCVDLGAELAGDVVRHIDAGARPLAGREVLVEVGLLTDDDGDPQHAALFDAI